MKILITFSLLCCITMLSACRVESDSRAYDEAPELRAFNIIDSYLTNSEFEPREELKLSPFIDDGEFEIFWDVLPETRYRVELFVNDQPNPDGGISVSRSWCGLGQPCGQFSYQYCEYKVNLVLQCAEPERSNPVQETDISRLFQDVPEQLYFSLEVCDRDLLYCEYRTKAVIFE